MPTEEKPAIRALCREDIPPAMQLVWRVFDRFEAPEYSDEGILEFKQYIEPASIEGRMEAGSLLLWGAFVDGEMVGVLAATPQRHISLLFVDAAYHRRGIAKALFAAMCEYFAARPAEEEITVNSSPYAVDVYRKLGFAPTDGEQTVNGIRFVPMARPLLLCAD